MNDAMILRYGFFYLFILCFIFLSFTCLLPFATTEINTIPYPIVNIKFFQFIKHDESFLDSA